MHRAVSEQRHHPPGRVAAGYHLHNGATGSPGLLLAGEAHGQRGVGRKRGRWPVLTRRAQYVPNTHARGADMGRCPTTHAVRRSHSFRATSGPVIRLRSGNVEAMIASDAASPPRTVAQYAIPGIRNAMSTWELR